MTNVGSDRAQLAKMATAARRRWARSELQAVADRGYFSGPRSRRATEAGITPLVPKPMTSNAKAEGRFSKADFIYIAKDDEYQCPAGERAIHRFTTVEDGMTAATGTGAQACPRCPTEERNARPATIGASRDGSTRRCSKRCSVGSIASPRR